MKSKTTAGLLGIFLGGFGAHHFYMERPGRALLYIFFCWTLIPGIVGFIEGIMYIAMSDRDWERSEEKRKNSY